MRWRRAVADIAHLEAEIDRLGAELQRLETEGHLLRGSQVKALDLVREGRDFLLLGSVPRAQECLAKACLVLLQSLGGC